MKTQQQVAPGAAAPSVDPLWYKDAVIYEVHIKAFYDSNGDGIGDFRGLTEKLDYIADLGINTIWVLPFYPSPLRDDGYDVANYKSVNPSYGTVEDFRAFVREAHKRGLRVITELVINHTSDQHPWFQAARRAPKGSRKRSYYVWSDDPNRYAGTRIIFTDTEKSNWSWDEVAQQYYWHRFFSHQPDLNFDNAGLRRAVFRIMRFWLDMGVDGFRLDAIPYLVEREGTSNENLQETHAVIKEMRRKLDENYTGKMFLAEANMWPEDVGEYFGKGDECHVCYHFPVMPRMYMAIAMEDSLPIVEILQQTPEIPADCQWAVFLRNHDELTLEMVTDREREYMWNTYSPDKRARINVGIRRRLAPLVDNDRARIKLLHSMLLSMPGAPVLYYGDEIGMGDNIYLNDRDGVRTPMQWSSDRNGGFSRADPQRLYLPAIQDPLYGYGSVNVEAQQRAPSSLLNWTRQMLALRKSTPVFGRGTFTLLRPANRKVLAYLRAYGDETVLCVANVSRSAQPVELDLARFKGKVPVEMMGRAPFPAVGEQPYVLTLPPHGFYWFLLGAQAPSGESRADRPAVETLPVAVLFDTWNSFFPNRVAAWRVPLAEKTRAQLETQLLPPFVAAQAWSPARGGAPRVVRIVGHAVLASHGAGQREPWLLAQADIEGDGGRVRGFLPLALGWEDRSGERVRQLAPGAIAKVRQQATVGLLADACGDPLFNQAVLEALADRRELEATGGKVRFVPAPDFTEFAASVRDTPAAVRTLGAAESTVAILGERLVVNWHRRIRPGVTPDLEIGRQLAGMVGATHPLALVGRVEFVGADGSVAPLGTVAAQRR
ncbi:MAG TPA: maltose alpha-D-glucosyltransferase [Burkholderiaceae bacterium]|nr:maltose alpha-D-glucosyltransferase [Burkholderiaceae bacterium]